MHCNSPGRGHISIMTWPFPNRLVFQVRWHEMRSHPGKVGVLHGQIWLSVLRHGGIPSWSWKRCQGPDGGNRHIPRFRLCVL